MSNAKQRASTYACMHICTSCMHACGDKCMLEGMRAPCCHLIAAPPSPASSPSPPHHPFFSVLPPPPFLPAVVFDQASAGASCLFTLELADGTSGYATLAQTTPAPPPASPKPSPPSPSRPARPRLPCYRATAASAHVHAAHPSQALLPSPTLLFPILFAHAFAPASPPPPPTADPLRLLQWLIPPPAPGPRLCPLPPGHPVRPVLCERCRRPPPVGGGHAR